MRRMHAQHHIGRDDGGAQIQRGAGFARHPFMFKPNQRIKALANDIHRQFRHAHDLARAIEALRMAIRAEQADLIIIAAKRLEPIKNRLAVMQHGCRGIEAERPIGDDPRRMPALIFLIIHQEHVIGQHLAEGKLIIGGLHLGGGGAGDREGSHGCVSSGFFLSADRLARVYVKGK